MATEELEVILTAEISKLRTELKKANSLLEETGKAAEGAGGKIDKDLTKSSKGAGTALKNLGLSVTSMAIGAATLAGVVVWAATKWYEYEFAVVTAEEALKKLNAGVDKYIKSLGDVARASLNASSSASKELTQLRLLKRQVEDTTKSEDLRRDGIRLLRAKFPAYFKELEDEKILNGEVSATYDRLTIAIGKRAKATAASELIVKNEKIILKAEERLLGLTAEQTVAEKELKQAKDESTTASKNFGRAGGGNVTGLFDINKASTKINENLEERFALQIQINKATEENARLLEVAAENATIDPNLKGPKTKPLGTETSALRFQSTLDSIPSKEVLDAAFAVLPSALDDLTQKTTNSFFKTTG